MMTLEELRYVLEPIETQLRRIADVLELLTAAPEPESPEPPCPHPLESRMDFGLTNGQPDWQCGLCGYRTVHPS
jgi:hypothetical protein